MNLPIILASASPARLELLRQVNIVPDMVVASNIDESKKKRELPNKLAERLAFEKAMSVANTLEYGIIIGADTVPVVGRSVMRKARNSDDIRSSLSILSNRRHRVYTGVCVIKKEKSEHKILKKVVKSTLKFKHLSNSEIDYYCNLQEGIDKAGGYTIDGYAQSYVQFISGSFSNVIGLPLFETVNMLNSLGFSIRKLVN
jgi:septum formation protein